MTIKERAEAEYFRPGNGQCGIRTIHKARKLCRCEPCCYCRGKEGGGGVIEEIDWIQVSKHFSHIRIMRTQMRINVDCMRIVFAYVHVFWTHMFDRLWFPIFVETLTNINSWIWWHDRRSITTTVWETHAPGSTLFFFNRTEVTFFRMRLFDLFLFFRGKLCV